MDRRRHAEIEELKMKSLILALTFGAFADTGALVEFHILPGTGESPWNTKETTVEVKVGDTVRIINDDSIPHTLHTFGRPCEHQPAASLPGEFYDCVIATTADPRIDLLYDHDFGQKARFYLKATNR